jgi:outer membrane protein assembly factor BamB
MRLRPRHASAVASLALAIPCAVWIGCNSIAGIQEGELASGDGAASGHDAGADSTPMDGTMGGDSPAESGADVKDVGVQDSIQETSAEAETSAPLTLCGDMAGLQPGSPWPMEARCPTRVSQAGGPGPTASTKGWTADVAGPPSGIVVAADGTLYVCAGGTLQAIGADATSKWEVSGVTCANTPAIGADGTIYVGGTNVLTALTPPTSTGGSPTTKWTFPTAMGTVSSPNIGGDGTVYVTVGSEVYAVASTGTQRWTYTTAASIPGMVAIGLTGMVYVVADTVYALDSAGTLKWRAANGDAGITAYYSPVVGPVVGSSEIVLLANESITAVSGGTQLWSTSIDGAPWASPAVAPDGTVYGVANGGNCVAMDPSTGTMKWTYTAADTILTQPAVDSTGSLYFLADGTVYGLTTSGTLLFSTSLGGQVSITQPVLANGQVLYVPATVSGDNAILQYGP